MKEEEFDKLPFCIRYKNAEKNCPKLHSDNWDELEDCCDGCGGNKYFTKKSFPSFIMDKTYDEIISGMK